MSEVASSREALDLLRANSQLSRQIREVYNRIIAIEAQHNLTSTSQYSDISRQLMFPTNLGGDVIKKRALNIRLRKELVDHRDYLTKLKAKVRGTSTADAPQTFRMSEGISCR